MRIDIHVHFEGQNHDQGSHDKLQLILEKLNEVLQKENIIMATLDDVIADVTDESTKIDSLSTFIAGLKQQIADALAGVTLPAGVQAKVDAVFQGVETNKAKVVAAMDANTPPPPPPPPANK